MQETTEARVTTVAEIITAIRGLKREELPGLLIAIAAVMTEQQAPTPDEDDLVGVNETARILGVSPSWIQHRPKLPFRRKIGGKLKFSRKGIAEWSKRDHHAV